MTKLFLMRSKSKRQDSGDVIVDLDKILTYRIIEKNGKFLLAADYTNKDSVRAMFDTLEDAKETLKQIFSFLNQDLTLADKIQALNFNGSENDRMNEILKEILDRI